MSDYIGTYYFKVHSSIGFISKEIFLFFVEISVKKVKLPLHRDA
jgi:hypothetical protein